MHLKNIYIMWKGGGKYYSSLWKLRFKKLKINIESNILKFGGIKILGYNYYKIKSYNHAELKSGAWKQIWQPILSCKILG